MPTAHCIGTPCGDIIDVDRNFCLLMGRSATDLIGVSYKTLTFKADLASSNKMLVGLIDRAAPTAMSKRYVRPDGSIVRADLLVTKFDNEERLITTLWWNEDEHVAASPGALWNVAVRMKHLYSCKMQEFGADLFGDFVGAILLHTYLAEAEGRAISVEEIAQSIGLNVGTADRWLKVLHQRGFVCPPDMSSGAVQLTHQGVLKMETLLWAAIGPPAYSSGSFSSV